MCVERVCLVQRIVSDTEKGLCCEVGYLNGIDCFFFSFSTLLLLLLLLISPPLSSSSMLGEWAADTKVVYLYTRFAEFRSCVKVEVAVLTFRPNKPYGFRGRKAILNRASALVIICP